MKKILIFTLVVSCLGLLTGCGKEKYAIYEMHSYDKDFKHTEELVVKYKEDGTIKYAEMYMVWDDVKNCESSIKNNSTSEDLKYPDVKYICNNDDGKTMVKWSMTDKSLENGYLKDEKKI